MLQYPAGGVCATLRRQGRNERETTSRNADGSGRYLSTIAPVPTFAEFEKTERNVQDLYKQCTHKEVLVKFFVWNLFQA